MTISPAATCSSSIALASFATTSRGRPAKSVTVWRVVMSRSTVSSAGRLSGVDVGFEDRRRDPPARGRLSLDPALVLVELLAEPPEGEDNPRVLDEGLEILHERRAFD